MKPENRALVLAIAITESGINYEAKHPDCQTFGIGGIKNLFWSDLLGDVNPNSFEAIDIIISYLIDKNNGNIYEAIKDYKGADKNLSTTNKCYSLYKQLKKQQ